MNKTRIAALAALAVAGLVLALAATSGASQPGGLWTPGQAENAVLDSDYADTWGLDEAVCVGRGAWTRNNAGGKTYAHFICSFSSDFNGPWSLKGLLAVGSDNVRWTMVMQSDYGTAQTIIGRAPDNATVSQTVTVTVVQTVTVTVPATTTTTPK